MALPRIQAAARGGGRVLGVEGQQDDFIGGEGREVANRRLRERMPIAHGHHHARYERLGKLGLERPRLPRRYLADRRLTADLLIVRAHFGGAAGRYEACQGFAGQAGKGEVDDVGVAKQVIEKGFDGVE